jgi:hypothetical protein
MVMHVAMVNATRVEFSENGPINVPEFGSVTTEEGLRGLLIIDPYLRVRDGTPYPAVLLTAGMHDPRVPAWQPAKLAARLQAATTSGRRSCCAWRPTAATASARPGIRRAPCSPMSWPSSCTRSASMILPDAVA